MPPWLRKLGRWVGYPLFFLLCFLLFAYWTFPYERVRDFIVQEVETEKFGRAAQAAEAAETGPSFMGAILVLVVGAFIGAAVGAGLWYAFRRSEKPWRSVILMTISFALIPVPLYLIWPREQPEVRRRPTGYQLEIVDLSPSWITGVDMTGVRFVKLPEDPEERAVDVTFESLHARIALLPLLTGTTDVSFEARVAGGTIEGETQINEGSQHVAATIAGVNLRRLGILRAFLPLPLSGTVDGEIDVNLNEDPTLTNGEIDLRLTALKVGDGNAKLKLDGMRDGVTVEQIDAGNVVLQARIEEGTATIRRLQGRGDDLELDGDGDVRLRSPLRASQLNMLIRAKFSDGYKERNDRTRALFSLLDLTPRARAAKTPDGALQYRIGGTIGGRVSTQAAGRAPAPGSGGGGDTGMR